MSLPRGKSTISMKLREVESAFRHRRIPYPKRSVELIALIAISCTFFLFMHTKNLNTRLREMEDKLQPSEFSALGLTGDHHINEESKHHDTNSLHGTYQYLKSTGQLETLNANKLNNTKNAQIEVVFFNRATKVGSESLMDLFSLLENLNDLDVHRNNQNPGDGRIRTIKEQQNLIDKIMELDDGGVYIEHSNYINFTQFEQPKPIYINLVRDPIERVISWFYYIRGSYRNAIFHRKLPNAEIETAEWFKKDFNECVRTGDPECSYIPYLVHDSADYRRQSLFFCGHNQNCLPFNSPTAIQRAKRTVEEEYAVVGSWEDTNVTLTVLEKYIPRYFQNAKTIFYNHHEKLLNRNRNKRKPIIHDDVKEMMRKNFTHEIDFYRFCKQRLYKQYIAIKLNDIHNIQS